MKNRIIYNNLQNIVLLCVKLKVICKHKSTNRKVDAFLLKLIYLLTTSIFTEFVETEQDIFPCSIITFKKTSFAKVSKSIKFAKIYLIGRWRLCANTSPVCLST